MDPQDKKSKDWSLFGKTEDRAIAKAKYKREMGINPAYKTEQNAEVSRSAQSMKNPTQRPYDSSTSPKDLAKPKPRKSSKGVEIPTGGTSVLKTISEAGDKGITTEDLYESLTGKKYRDESRLINSNGKTSADNADPAYRKKYPKSNNTDKGNLLVTASKTSGPRISDSGEAQTRKTFGSRSAGPSNKVPSRSKASPVPPKPKAKPVSGASSSSGGDKKVVAASDKSRTAPKMTAFQRQKARQFEKEGYAGRSMTAAQAKRKASEKGSGVSGLSKLFGISKTPKAAPKKPEAKRSGPLKSAFAQISYQGRKK